MSTLPARHRSTRHLARRYPGIAVVAGASEGIGRAFARELAREGFELLLVARRRDPLAQLAEELRGQTGAVVRTLSCDLAGARAVDELLEACADRRVGLLVYNAAAAPVGRFASLAPESIETLGRVNMITPMLAIRRLVADRAAPSATGPADASPRAAAERSGVVIMSSMAGWHGSTNLAAYSASKSFLRTLAEALWAELRPQGIDVIACVAGATDTPGYRSQSGGSFGVLTPRRVARAALRRIGRGPIVVPGLLYRIAAVFMNRIVPRRLAVRVMSAATQDLGRRAPG